MGSHSEYDWQSQMEELAVLDSIYAGDFRLLQCPGLSGAIDDVDADALLCLPCPAAGAGLVRFEVAAPVDVPGDGLQLLLDITDVQQPGSPTESALGAEDGGTGCSETIGDGLPAVPQGLAIGPRVVYLPPISMLLQLPTSYPSTSEPLVQLHANWLTQQQAASLEQGLKVAWEDQGPGAPVVFLWAEWLRSHSLSCLGVAGSLPLGNLHGRPRPVQQPQPGNPDHLKASGGLPSCEEVTGPGAPAGMAVAVQVLRYAAAREGEAFRQATWTCSICYDQVPGASCVRLPECSHFFCGACLSTHCSTQLQSGAVENMRCPDPSCRLAIAPGVLQDLLGQEGFQRWEALLLQRTLDRMSDVVYCPRCEAVCIEDSQNCAQCGQCQYVFCSLCSDVWHPPSERCMDPEQRLLVLERRRGRGGGSADHARQQDLVNQMQSLKLVQQTSKRCPACQMAISKTEGCNKMVCAYCSAAWCWRCERVVKGYEHFRESQCQLFDQSEIDRWNRQMWQAERAQEVERGQIMMQVLAAHGGVPLCPCPVCGQANAKQGRNNAMRCWSCNQHFCASCRTWLRGKVGSHYTGGSKCRQHS